MENNSANWTNISSIRIEATSFEQSVLTILKSSILILIILLALLSNLLVISSVYLFRRLRHVNNYFLVSLAFADLSVALFAMTFNATVEITGSWHFGPVMCNFWNAMDVHVSTVSTLHLCCISIDRFYAIVKPFSYLETMTVRVAMTMIMCAWLSPAVISFVPIFLGWYTTQEHLDLRQYHQDECKFIVNKPYAIISSTLTFWAPVLITLILYYRVYRVASEIKKREFRSQSVPSCASVGQIAGQKNNTNAEDQNEAGKQNNSSGNNQNRNGKDHQIERNVVAFKDERDKNTQVKDTNIIAILQEKDKDIIKQSIDHEPNGVVKDGSFKPKTGATSYDNLSPYHSFELIDADPIEDLRLLERNSIEKNNIPLIPSDSQPNSIQTYLQISEHSAEDDNKSDNKLWAPGHNSQTDLLNNDKKQTPHFPLSPNHRDGELSTSNLSQSFHLQQNEDHKDSESQHYQTDLLGSNFATRGDNVNTEISNSSKPQILFTLECPNSSGDETFCLLDVNQGLSKGNGHTGENALQAGFVESTRRLSQQCITVIEEVREKQRRWGTNWRKEHKAFVTLGVVVGAFLACWLPFFTWYLTVTICGSHCSCPDIIVSVLFWIGYLNSTLNPIIYAMTNHDFKEAFTAIISMIFCCNANSLSQCERNLWIKKFG